MAVSITCNHSRMKGINTSAILNILSKKGAASRVEIAEMLGLDNKTITNLVRDLIAKGLIMEGKSVKLKTGRPKQLLELNPQGCDAIAVFLRPQVVTVSLVNLTGQIRSTVKRPLKWNDTSETILKKISGAIHDVIAKEDKSPIKGIGLAYHGVIDRQTGIVRNASMLKGWEGVCVPEFFKREFPSLPFEMEDNVECIAVAESWYGAARDFSDFMMVELGVGIGSTLYISDEFLNTGRNAGEIGHCVVVDGGAVCSCGQKGCLETVASLRAVEDLYKQAKGLHNNVDFKTIAQRADQGEKQAVEVINKAGEYIGHSVSFIVNAINPVNIVLVGEMVDSCDLLLQSIDGSIKDNCSFFNTNLVKGSLGEKAGLIGAGMLVLRKLFERN